MSFLSNILPSLTNMLPGGSLISGLLSKVMPGFKDAASSGAAQTLMSGAAGGFAANGLEGGLFGQHEMQDTEYDEDQVDSQMY